MNEEDWWRQEEKDFWEQQEYLELFSYWETLALAHWFSENGIGL